MPFALKKFIVPFLIPPGIIVVLLFLTGVRLCLRRTLRGGLACMSLAILLWLLATAPVAELLMRPLERGFSIPRPLRGDVIVLLGGGIHDRVPDLTGSGAPSGDALARLVTAARAYQTLHLPMIVSGGKAAAGRMTEAEIDRRFLTDLGVPAKMVIMEDKSSDTMENAQKCGEILRRHGFTHPLLVTSAYHMRRAVADFEKAGVKVTPLPAQFFVFPERTYVWDDILPDAGALKASATALKEYLGILYNQLNL